MGKKSKKKTQWRRLSLNETSNQTFQASKDHEDYLNTSRSPSPYRDQEYPRVGSSYSYRKPFYQNDRRAINPHDSRRFERGGSVDSDGQPPNERFQFSKSNGRVHQDYHRSFRDGPHHPGDRKKPVKYFGKPGFYRGPPLHGGFKRRWSEEDCQQQYPDDHSVEGAEDASERPSQPVHTVLIDNEEYTRIQTPRQEVIFKKASLDKRRDFDDRISVISTCGSGVDHFNGVDPESIEDSLSTDGVDMDSRRSARLYDDPGHIFAGEPGKPPLAGVVMQQAYLGGPMISIPVHWTPFLDPNLIPGDTALTTLDPSFTHVIDPKSLPADSAHILPVQHDANGCPVTVQVKLDERGVPIEIEPSAFTVSLSTLNPHQQQVLLQQQVHTIPNTICTQLPEVTVPDSTQIEDKPKPVFTDTNEKSVPEVSSSLGNKVPDDTEASDHKDTEDSASDSQYASMSEASTTPTTPAGELSFPSESSTGNKTTETTSIIDAPLPNSCEEKKSSDVTVSRDDSLLRCDSSEMEMEENSPQTLGDFPTKLYDSFQPEEEEEEEDPVLHTGESCTSSVNTVLPNTTDESPTTTLDNCESILDQPHSESPEDSDGDLLGDDSEPTGGKSDLSTDEPRHTIDDLEFKRDNAKTHHSSGDSTDSSSKTSEEASWAEQKRKRRTAKSKRSSSSASEAKSESLQKRNENEDDLASNTVGGIPAASSCTSKSKKLSRKSKKERKKLREEKEKQQQEETMETDDYEVVNSDTKTVVDCDPNDVVQTENKSETSTVEDIKPETEGQPGYVIVPILTPYYDPAVLYGYPLVMQEPEQYPERSFIRKKRKKFRKYPENQQTTVFLDTELYTGEPYVATSDGYLIPYEQTQLCQVHGYQYPNEQFSPAGYSSQTIDQVQESGQSPSQGDAPSKADPEEVVNPPTETEPPLRSDSNDLSDSGVSETEELPPNDSDKSTESSEPPTDEAVPEEKLSLAEGDALEGDVTELDDNLISIDISPSSSSSDSIVQKTEGSSEDVAVVAIVITELENNETVHSEVPSPIETVPPLQEREVDLVKREPKRDGLKQLKTKTPRRKSKNSPPLSNEGVKKTPSLQEPAPVEKKAATANKNSKSNSSSERKVKRTKSSSINEEKVSSIRTHERKTKTPKRDKNHLRDGKSSDLSDISLLDLPDYEILSDSIQKIQDQILKSSPLSLIPKGDNLLFSPKTSQSLCMSSFTPVLTCNDTFLSNGRRSRRILNSPANNESALPSKGNKSKNKNASIRSKLDVFEIEEPDFSKMTSSPVGFGSINLQLLESRVANAKKGSEKEMENVIPDEPQEVIPDKIKKSGRPKTKKYKKETPIKQKMVDTKDKQTIKKKTRKPSQATPINTVSKVNETKISSKPKTSKRQMKKGVPSIVTSCSSSLPLSTEDETIPSVSEISVDLNIGCSTEENLPNEIKSRTESELSVTPTLESDAVSESNSDTMQDNIDVEAHDIPDTGTTIPDNETCNLTFEISSESTEIDIDKFDLAESFSNEEDSHAVDDAIKSIDTEIEPVEKKIVETNSKEDRFATNLCETETPSDETNMNFNETELTEPEINNDSFEITIRASDFTRSEQVDQELEVDSSATPLNSFKEKDADSSKMLIAENIELNGERMLNNSESFEEPSDTTSEIYKEPLQNLGVSEAVKKWIREVTPERAFVSPESTQSIFLSTIESGDEFIDDEIELDVKNEPPKNAMSNPIIASPSEEGLGFCSDRVANKYQGFVLDSLDESDRTSVLSSIISRRQLYSESSYSLPMSTNLSFDEDDASGDPRKYDPTIYAKYYHLGVDVDMVTPVPSSRASSQGRDSSATLYGSECQSEDIDAIAQCQSGANLDGTYQMSLATELHKAEKARSNMNHIHESEVTNLPMPHCGALSAETSPLSSGIGSSLASTPANTPLHKCSEKPILTPHPLKNLSAEDAPLPCKAVCCSVM